MCNGGLVVLLGEGAGDAGSTTPNVRAIWAMCPLRRASARRLDSFGSHDGRAPRPARQEFALFMWAGWLTPSRSSYLGSKLRNR